MKWFIFTLHRCYVPTVKHDTTPSWQKYWSMFEEV